MRAMMGMPEIRMEMMEMGGIGIQMWEIKLGMRGAGGRNEGNQGDNFRIGVEIMNKNM